MKRANVAPSDLDCRDAIKLIAEYLDSHLRGKPAKALEKHIEACRHCFDRMEFEKLLKSRLRRLQSGGNPDRLRKKIDALFEPLHGPHDNA